MEGLTFDVGMNAGNFNTGVKSMETSMGGLGKLAKEIGGMITIAFGGAAIIGAINKSITGFQTMETGLREISTLVSGDLQPTIEKYESSVETIMKSTGDSTDEATAAVYNFVSAFGDLDDASGIIAVASKQSVAGVTDTKTAINFLASTIFGFGIPATEEMTMQMADLGQMTVKLARTTLPELEAAIRESTATASQLNVSPEEYFSNIAAGTKILGSATQTGTAFKMVLSNLLKPTEAMSGALKSYGMEIGLTENASAGAIIASQGFSVALRGIVKEAGGSDEKLGEMFQSVNALNLAMALTGPLTGEVDKNLIAMGDSAGSVDEAYDKMADTSEMTTKKMKAQAELFTATFGELFDSVTRPMVENFTVVMEGWTDRLKTFTEGFKDWQAELAKDDSFGGEMIKSLSGAAPLTVPIMFAVAAAQKGLGSLMSNIGGFGEGLKVVGGKIKGAAGVAALSMGISLAINDIQKGEDLKKVGMTQAIGAALGLGAGLIGGAAVGQMVYGITVAITDIILTKSPEEYFKNLQTTGMGGIDLITSAQPSEATKDNFIDQYKSLNTMLKSVMGSEDYEIRLKTDEKAVLEQVSDYTKVLGEELKKDPLEMDLSKIKQQFTEIDFLSLGMAEGLTTKEGTKYLDGIFGLREKLLGETISVASELNAKFDYITSQTYGEYAFQFNQIVQEAKKSAWDALSEDPTQFDNTINSIQQMTKSALEGLDVTDIDMSNAMDALNEEIANVMENVDKTITSEGFEEIKINIDTKSLAEQLQSTISAQKFEANAIVDIANMDEFVSMIENLDLESSIGLDPNEKELISTIMALDLPPVELLIQPKLQTLRNFINQLRQEMGVPVESQSDENYVETENIKINPSKSTSGSFSTGGYTANVGINAPAGVVHGGEWIAPAWMVNNSKYSETIDSLENVRNNRGYSNGGIVSPQAAGRGATNIININVETLVGDNEEAANVLAATVYKKLEEQGVLA